MRIFLEKFYNMQERLDKIIEVKHNVDFKSQIIFQKRVIALQVELAELAQELRFFKYWSTNQKPSERVLAEYVDSFHFLLSMTNTLNCRELEFSYPNDADNTPLMTMDEMFSLTMTFAGQMFDQPLKIGYAFMSFLDLGFKIGLKWEDIVEEYKKKHAENLLRQDSGY